MGKCSVCGKKIEYNQFKWYRGKIQCYDCYKTRLERKKAKKEAAEKTVEEDKNDKELKNIGVTVNVTDDFNPYKEPKEKAEELAAYEDKEQEE